MRSAIYLEINLDSSFQEAGLGVQTLEWSMIEEDLVNLLVYMTMSVSLQYRLDYCCCLQVSDLTRFYIRTMRHNFSNLRFDNDVNELLTHFFTYLV